MDELSRACRSLFPEFEPPTIPGWVHVGNSSRESMYDAIAEYAEWLGVNGYRAEPFEVGEVRWAVYARGRND